MTGRSKISEYIPVPAVWTHFDSPMSEEDLGPAVRVMGSIDYPGDFVFQFRDSCTVTSVRLPLDVIGELHRQAAVVDTAGRTYGLDAGDQR